MEINGRIFKITPRDVQEEMAVEKALGCLPYGQFNARAKDVEEETRRTFREQHPVEGDSDPG
jgi:hypothetical protein